MGELEGRIMDLLWDREGPVTVREVLEELAKERSLAYTTVMTVMDNLHRKGLLRRERSGKAYLYRPAMARSEHTADLMGELLEGSGDRAMTLLRFLDRIDHEERASLRAWLKRKDFREVRE
ncbi:MAG: BlaI/MecI/CopY family transcriptional regulator [Motilibacteraceae bacterium]